MASFSAVTTSCNSAQRHPSGNSPSSALSVLGASVGTGPRAWPAKAAWLPPHSIELLSSIALWSAPAERSGDGALASGGAVLPNRPVFVVLTRSIQSQSGVALRLPPHSIVFGHHSGAVSY